MTQNALCQWDCSILKERNFQNKVWFLKLTKQWNSLIFLHVDTNSKIINFDQ